MEFREATPNFVQWNVEFKVTSRNEVQTHSQKTFLIKEMGGWFRK
jgi:hypothetical protein